MPDPYDVIVVGCGAAGSSAAWHLARRGVRVLAIDAHSPPHPHGSSHGHTRMTRTAYYEHPDYVPLLLRSHALWRELETATHQSLLHFTGGLYIGPESSELITGSARSAAQFGLKTELLSPSDLARRFPQFTPAPGSIALLESQAGYLLVERAIGSLVHAALAHGATLLPRTRVTAIEEHPGHIAVRTESATFHAGHVVVTAGAWATKLLGPAIPKVSPTRQTLGWFWPEQAERFRDIPVWAFDTGGGSLFYGFPMLADRPGLKCAHHSPGPPTDPDAVERTITASDESSLRTLLDRFIPSAATGPMLDMATCLYENSPDGHFLLGPISDRMTVAAGLSGHGFKFAPVLGEVLADLATTGQTTHPIDFLSPKRTIPA